MNSDDSSNLNDFGVNMDSASASSQTHRANMDPITSYDDHPGIHTGQSSSSQVSTIDPNIHLRCVNCGINISRLRRHQLVIAEVRRLILRWNEPQQLPSSASVCLTCWRRIDRAASRTIIQQDTPAQPSSVQSESTDTVTTTEEESVAADNCILLPNYIRAPSTQSRCFVPNCVRSERLTVPT